jgi:S-adenosylmethionine:diacylglycerol 3-amino-3-carboxypropyl transferase
MDINDIRIVNAEQAKDKHVFNIIKEKLYKTNTDMNKSKNIQVVFMRRWPTVNEGLKDFLNNGLT